MRAREAVSVAEIFIFARFRTGCERIGNLFFGGNGWVGVYYVGCDDGVDCRGERGV